MAEKARQHGSCSLVQPPSYLTKPYTALRSPTQPYAALYTQQALQLHGLTTRRRRTATGQRVAAVCPGLTGTNHQGGNCRLDTSTKCRTAAWVQCMAAAGGS